MPNFLCRAVANAAMPFLSETESRARLIVTRSDIDVPSFVNCRTIARERSPVGKLPCAPGSDSCPDRIPARGPTKERFHAQVRRGIHRHVFPGSDDRLRRDWKPNGDDTSAGDCG